jgi:hypothetical protein
MARVEREKQMISDKAEKEIAELRIKAEKRIEDADIASGSGSRSNVYYVALGRVYALNDVMAIIEAEKKTTCQGK